MIVKLKIAELFDSTKTAEAIGFGVTEVISPKEKGINNKNAQITTKTNTSLFFIKKIKVKVI